MNVLSETHLNPPLQVSFLFITADPRTEGGLRRGVGSVAMAADGSLYKKTGTADTDWLPLLESTGQLTVLQKTITLTDEQIKALPVSPAVIVPATETLDYTNPITSVPVLMQAVIATDFSAGGYSNLDSNSFLTIALGSDYSMDASMLLEIGGSDFGSASRRVLFTLGPSVFAASPGFLGTGGPPVVGFTTNRASFKDNALALAIGNVGGALTGGHPNNSLTASIAYYRLEV